jgi:glycosyltransferase involved in cell wall biosynthesis
MNVCHFAPSDLDFHHFRSLAVGLPPRGVHPVFVSLDRAGRPAWRREAPQVPCYSLTRPRRRQFPAATVALARILHRHRVDVLQTHQPVPGAIGLLAGKLTGIPVIHMRQHLDLHWMMDSRLHVEADRLMARAANHVVVPSNALREFMFERESIDRQRVEVIYHGFDFNLHLEDPDGGRRVRRELGLEGTFVIGCVSRFAPAKGHDVLLKATARLRDRIPNLRLLLVGGRGDRSGAEREVERLGLREEVLFAGQRDDIAACMSAMDVMVSASLSEPFGQVIVEALAAATPVVATNVGGVPEIIDHEETGLLVPPGDPEVIERAVLRLYGSPELRERLAREGVARVQAQFSFDTFLDRQVQAYERCLSG